MNSMLEMLKLSGRDIPSVFEYNKRKDKIIKEAVELTEKQWDALDPNFKDTINGTKYYLIFEAGVLGMVPVKPMILKGLNDYPPSEEKIDTASTETVKSENKTDGENHAADQGKKMVDAVLSGKRISNTSELNVDSEIRTDKPKDTLADNLPKEEDLQDNPPAKELKKVKESAEDIANRIVKAVKGGNAPKNAKNSGDTTNTKPKVYDFSKWLADGKSWDDPDPEAKRVSNDKTGRIAQKNEKVEVPSEVLSQIDTRIKELKEAQVYDDQKGYDGKSMKQNAIDVLEKIREHLTEATLPALNHARILLGTLSNSVNVSDFLPISLTRFLAQPTNNGM